VAETLGASIDTRNLQTFALSIAASRHQVSPSLPEKLLGANLKGCTCVLLLNGPSVEDLTDASSMTSMRPCYIAHQIEDPFSLARKPVADLFE